jgi:hypothetical protein
MAFLDDAHRLLEHGYTPIPLDSEKNPHFPALASTGRQAAGQAEKAEWASLRTRPPDDSELHEWAKLTANIGAIIPSGRNVVDFDHGRPDLLDTPTVATARGLHLYVTGTLPTRPFTVDSWAGEVRGAGSYVAAPHSLHESGKTYTWLLGPEAATAPIEAITVGGVGLLDALTEQANREVTQEGIPSRVTSDLREEDLTYGPVEKARMVRQGLGIEVRIGSKFRCILPGHTEMRPSASIDRASYIYRDWHRSDTGGVPWYTLAEVFASQENEMIVSLRDESPVWRRRWWDRLAFKSGVLKLTVPVPPAVPEKLTEDQERVAYLFGVLLAINWLRYPGEPVSFSARFAASWCGLSVSTAHRAIDHLRKLDVLRRRERVKTSSYDANTYLLGDGNQRPRPGSWDKNRFAEAAP